MINIVRGENITSISKINSAQISNTSNATQTYYNGGKEGVDYRFLEYGINYDITEPILLNDIAPEYLKDEDNSVLEYDDLESLMDIAIPTDIIEDPDDSSGLKFFGSYRIGQRYLYVFHLLPGDNKVELYSDSDHLLLTLKITNSPDEKIVENEKIVYLAFSMDSEQVEGTLRVAYNAWTRLVNPVRHKFSLALKPSDINTEPKHIERDSISGFWLDGSGNIYGTREIGSNSTSILNEKKAAYGGPDFYSPWKAYKSGEIVRRKLKREVKGVTAASFIIFPGPYKIISTKSISRINGENIPRTKIYEDEAESETTIGIITVEKSDIIIISTDPNSYMSLKDDNINHPVSSVSPWWMKVDNLDNYYTRVITLKCDHGELEKTRFNFLSGIESVNTKLMPNLGYEPIMADDTPETQTAGIVVTKNMIEPGEFPNDTYYNVELTPIPGTNEYEVKTKKVDNSGISFKFNLWEKVGHSWSSTYKDGYYLIDDFAKDSSGLDSGIQVNVIYKEVEIFKAENSYDDQNPEVVELKEYLGRLNYYLDGYSGSFSYSSGTATILPPYKFTEPVYNFDYRAKLLSVLVANAGDWSVDKQYSENVVYGSDYEVKVYYNGEEENYIPQICFNKDFSHWHDMIQGGITLDPDELPTFVQATIQKDESGKLYTIKLEGITIDTKIDIK